MHAGLVPLVLTAVAVATVFTVATASQHAPSAADAAFASERRHRDGHVDGCIARTRRQPRSWLAWESLANAYQARAWLGGGGADLERAGAALERSFAEAPSGAGPFLARARLLSARHRWDAAEPDLRRAEQAAVVSFHDQASIAALRAERAHEHGAHADSIALWRHACDRHPAARHLAALAHALEGAGDPAGADAALARADAEPFMDAPTRAWLELQRCDLAIGRGDVAGARRAADAAEAAMPGWPRADEAMARVLADGGDVDGAIARLRRAAAHGSPTAMGDLSMRLRGRDDVEAARWKSLARAAHEALLADDPVSGCGHALEHWLTVEPDAARAVALAERNHQLRPGGEGLVLLARAYRLAGRDAEARAALDRSAALGWRSPAWRAALATMPGDAAPVAVQGTARAAGTP